MSKTTAQKIDELFDSIDVSKQQQINSFVEAIRNNLSNAETGLRRLIVAFLITWTVFYAIAVGLIQEGQIGSFKIETAKDVLVAAPLIMGALAYAMLAIDVAAAQYMTVLSACYKRLLPKAHELSLQYLLAPPTFKTVETHLQGLSKYPWMNSFSNVWLFSLEAAAKFLPAFAIGHVSYVLVTSVDLESYIEWPSIIFGFMLWIRGLMLVIGSPE